jgi:peptidoglycan/LPS O-acetylase OafA/YrhL
VNSECPNDNWISIEINGVSKCYMVSDEVYTQPQCEQDVCRKDSGTLVHIESAEENDFLSQKFDPMAYWMWIGYYRSTNVSGWTWTSTDKKTSDDYEVWAFGEPGNWCGTENCVISDPQGWHDIDCRVRLRCLCQYPGQTTASYEKFAETIDSETPPYMGCEEAEFKYEFGEIFGFAFFLWWVSLFGICCSIPFWKAPLLSAEALKLLSSKNIYKKFRAFQEKAAEKVGALHSSFSGGESMDNVQYSQVANPLNGETNSDMVLDNSTTIEMSLIGAGERESDVITSYSALLRPPIAAVPGSKLCIKLPARTSRHFELDTSTAISEGAEAAGAAESREEGTNELMDISSSSAQGGLNCVEVPEATRPGCRFLAEIPCDQMYLNVNLHNKQLVLYTSEFECVRMLHMKGYPGTGVNNAGSKAVEYVLPQAINGGSLGDDTLSGDAGAAQPRDAVQVEKINLNANRTVPTEAFQCLRGCGSIQILLGHFFFFFVGKSGDSLQYEFGGGNAVNMFFVMSGFLMIVGYAEKYPISDGAQSALLLVGKDRGEEEFSSDTGVYLGRSCNRLEVLTNYDKRTFAKKFWWRRVARICPMLWFSLLVCMPLSIVQLVMVGDDVEKDGRADVFTTMQSYVQTALGIQGWTFNLAVNGPLWAVSSQAFLYLNFPFLLERIHKIRNLPRWLSGIAGNWMVYFMIWWFLFVISGFNYYIPHIFPIPKLPLFIIGMIYGSQALANVAVTNKSEHYIRKWSWIADGITVFLGIFTLIELDVGGVLYQGGFLARVFGEWMFPALYGLWMYALTQAPTSKSYQIFITKPFMTLGAWSYCIYVLQFPILMYYCWMRFGNKYFNQCQPREDSDYHLHFLEVVPCVLLVVGLASLAHKHVEVPSRQFLNALFSR